MTDSQPTVLELAKQGDAGAIAALINRALQPKGITAKTILDNGCLHVRLESEELPAQAALAEFVRKGVTNLNVDAIKTVKLYGIKVGQQNPVWQQTFELKPADDLPEIAHVELYPQEEVPVDALDEVEYTTPDLKPKAGFAKTFRQNWKVLPMMLLAAVVGFFLVVFIWNRVKESASVSSLSPTSSSPEASTSSAAPPASPADPASPSPTTTAASLTASPTPSNQSSPAPSVTQSTTLLNQAYRLGMSAAVKTQTATTKGEWATVIAEWQQAIQALTKIPSGDPNHGIAQTKIRQYQRNLDYAQQRARKALSP